MTSNRPKGMVVCDRCGRRETLNRATSQEWNFTAKDGEIVGYTCDRCETAEENAEAEINWATSTYTRDAFGRLRQSPKVPDDETGPGREVIDYEALVMDLVRRIEAAIEQVERLGTGVVTGDVVQLVEDDLPPGYPMPAAGGEEGRREMIARMAADILSGKMYDDDGSPQEE